MPDKNNTVILYLIATPQDYPNLRNRTLLYTVRGTVYSAPLDAEGKLDVGGAITVYAEDVEELIQKSRFQTKQREIRFAFTKSPSEAALRKEAWLKGETYAPGAVTDANYAVTPDVIKLQAATVLSTEDLVELLAQKGIKVTAEPTVVAAPPPPRKKAPQPPPVTVDDSDAE